jgi:LEA14-like dessication related protein
MRTGDVLLLFGGVVGLYYLTKSRAANNLTFYPGSITGMGLQNGEPMMQLDFIVQNTSNADVALNSIAGNAYSNGYLVGNISNFQGAVIRGNSETRVPVLVRFNLIGAVNDIIDAFQTGNFRQDITIEGRVNGEGISVPIELKFQV